MGSSSTDPSCRIRVYRNSFPDNLVGEVAADQPLKFEEDVHDNGRNTYYVVSVDFDGTTSLPASVVIDPR